jgi:glutamate/tyrosine decarboxylase-like PLP-dependent enzyme
MNVVGQLYQFTRMGFDGYQEVNMHMLSTMRALTDGLRKLKVGQGGAGQGG